MCCPSSIVGQAEERTPTDIDSVYHIRFRMVLPLGVNLKVNITRSNDYRNPLMVEEKDNTPPQIDENNRNALVYIEAIPNNILVLPWRIKKFFRRNQSVTNTKMHNTISGMHKDAAKDAQKFGVAGTGFFIAPDLLVTNIHVVASAQTVAAKQLTFKKTPIYHPDHKDIAYGYKREISKDPIMYTIDGVKADDASNDLVILKVNEKCATHLHLSNSENVNEEDSVFTLTYANAEYKCIKGEISGRNERKWLEILTQYTAGDSGSPVLSTNSEVIGIACLMDQLQNGGVLNPYGLGSAIPSNYLENLLEHSGDVESFFTWQKRPAIRAYALLHQAQRKHAQGKYRSVIAKYNRIHKLNPDIVVVYSNRGAAKSALGNYNEAIEDFDDIIQRYPNYTSAYYNRGRAKVSLGDKFVKRGKLVEARNYYHNAIADYTEVIKQDPKRSIAHNNRGWTSYLLGQLEAKEGNQSEILLLFQKAITDADEALRLQPEGDLYRSSFYHTRGAAKAALGEHDQAIEDFDESINLNPEKALLYYDRGLSRQAIDQHEDARADFAKARELDPKIGK